jgi:CheY-like chemotaxis protein
MARNVLVIDDQPLVREVVQSMLEFRGYAVLLAEDGPRGLELSINRPVDVALVDVDMPRMDGFAVCRALRGQCDAGGRPLVIWLMTGVATPELAERAQAAGAAGILPKPFTTDELVSRIEGRPCVTHRSDA